MRRTPKIFLSMACGLFLCASAPARAAEVVFAQIASQSNPASIDNAKGLTTGIQVYFEALNAKGGVNGNKLKLEVHDDGLQAKNMVELTGKLIDNPAIVGLVGFLNTAGMTMLAKENAFGKGAIALIAPMQGDKNVVEADNVFPLRSGYADEIDALLKEAKTWGKDTVSIVNMNIAFGPILAELAQKRATDLGLKVVSRSVVDFSPDAQAASVSAAVKSVVAAHPKAILVLAAGMPAFEFIKAVRAVPEGLGQIYGLSVLRHSDLIAITGVNKARGIVLSQATPYPFTSTKPVITEYQAAMKAHDPKAALSFSSLEGFLGAKIAAEAVRRAGANPSRERVLGALKTMQEYNLGGISVNYSAQARKGWGGVDLTIISATGNLQK
ncbi:amino acid/amide ABC transporter substrate-binding protein, HAAT family [Polaromonas naphthalenivorans CJ2]|uniref:Amino acid/amide ABC transporter substrate-binding protein, HAAT family n=1 Tax=Polaromonas naphthalenivorans (strain CJ2) TaxID=365044 RepID=A1VMX5_POLNA|nr:amino acid/amide ABC transporter substrate-binding protein, HAAT family [Polaromonas naphthalenivorans CJ2]